MRSIYKCEKKVKPKYINEIGTNYGCLDLFKKKKKKSMAKINDFSK